METVKRLFISLLVLLGCSAGSWAIEQDSDGYYLIGSVQDWKDFANIVQNTNQGANAKMVADVDLGGDQTKIGATGAYDSSPCFSGTFDGQGYTLTVAYTGITENYVGAPFAKINGATIKNLHVAGTINSGGFHPSVVSDSWGTSTIENVWSSLVITSTRGGWVECGGIVGCMKNGNLTVRDCLFTGSITASGGYNGCFVGYKDGGTGTIINCLSLGTFSYPNGYNSWTSGPAGTHNNCFVKQYQGNDIPAAMKVTDEQLAGGTIATALQADRSEEIWVQDPELGIPMLKIFADAGEDVIDPSFISGLVQHWPFDGNATNAVSGGVDATVYGATLTTDRFGNENSAYYFDGNDKMIAAGAANFGTTSFTANIWVSSTMTSGLGNLMRTDGGYYKGWLLRFNSGKIEIWEGRSYSIGYVSTNSYADGNWHMVTFVRDVENKVGQLYVDGSYVGGYSMGSTINDVSNELRFGTYGSGEYYTGKMDDACLYNRALSAEEIAALYTQNGFTIYTVPASGLGTFSAAYNIVIPEELTAYYCTTLKTYKDGSLGVKVSKLEGGIIPANTGVLIEGPANQSYTLLATNEETTAPAGNSLVAVVESKHIAATDGDYSNFMMKGGKFVKIADDNASMPAHRAYLPLLTEAISGSNAKEIMLYWDDEETTGIESLTPSQSPKGEGSIYNLNGQKLSSPRKGINIINGRKVIVK